MKRFKKLRLEYNGKTYKDGDKIEFSIIHKDPYSENKVEAIIKGRLKLTELIKASVITDDDGEIVPIDYWLNEPVKTHIEKRK